LQVGVAAGLSYHRYPVSQSDAILLSRKSLNGDAKVRAKDRTAASVEIFRDFGRPIAALLCEMP
jgi:hypothetical protein